ncbi:hypothetical protein BDR26DRAFT_861921 [Obelidium mucronatum]|nr:hypothetical protein BDR26DRAFT_861921 [Obelidium mucronatum]
MLCLLVSVFLTSFVEAIDLGPAVLGTYGPGMSIHAANCQSTFQVKGNSSCNQVASSMAKTENEFKQLNPWIDCNVRPFSIIDQTIVCLSPGTSSMTVSWHWFNDITFDCFPSIKPTEYNSGYFAGSEKIPADCGKQGTFSWNGNSVTVTYAWRTTGGLNYHEVSATAFAKLIGSREIVVGKTVEQFQVAIQDPGKVGALCAGVC